MFLHFRLSNLLHHNMYISCPIFATNMQNNKKKYLLYLNMILVIISRVRPDCPDHCVCNGTDLECYTTLPSFIPENISSVTAHEVPLEPYMNFTYTDWQSVTHLSLSLGNVNKKKFTLGRLQDYEFTGLMNLQHLKLLCHCRLSVNSSAFYGLINVTVLDLSNNTVGWGMSDIVSALRGEDILPNISELYLSNSTYWYGPTASLSLYLDKLHTAMENKPLQVLDLSGTSLVFYLSLYPPPPSLLPQLHTLNISRAGPAVFSLSRIYRYYTQRPEAVFSNLRVLDASYPYFPQSQSECEKSYNYRQFCTTGQHTTNVLPSNLAELHLNNIFGSKVSYLDGVSNSSHLCLNYTIFNINRSISITWHTNYLQKLDISGNDFAYIQPGLIQPIKSLRYLDVSNNKLGTAMANSNYTRALFYALKKIEVLLFSNNSITFLPSDILKYNNTLKIIDLSHNRLTSVNFDLTSLTELKKMDLSHNELTSVTFGLTYLRIIDLSHNRLTSVNLGLNGQVPLELLDLSYNRIVSADAAGCEMLNNLHFNDFSFNLSSHNNGKTGLILNGNQLSCSCPNVCVFYFLQDQNKTLNCSTNGKTKIVDYFFVERLENSCRVFIPFISSDAVLTIIITAGVPIFILIVGMIYYCKKDWKEKKRVKAMRIVIERGIERGIERQSKGEEDHIAFLSYSSDDRTFVLNNVFPKLDEGLRGILKVAIRCVGTGDHDMVPGRRIDDEIIKVVEKSSVVIFFVTKSFCEQYWCKFELDTAICTEKPIILMMYGKVKRRSMPSVLRNRFETYVRVHWTIQNGVPVMTPDWDVLCSSIVRLLGEQPNPTPDNDSESDDNENGIENSVCGGDSGTAAPVASGGRDNLRNCDNDAEVGGSSDAAVAINCTDAAEGCSANGDCTAVVANPCTDTAEKCSASSDCTAINRGKEMVESGYVEAMTCGNIQVVADVHVNGRVDSVRDAGDDNLVANCGMKVCDNVQVVGNTNSGANTRKHRFGAEKHDDTIHHISEVENINGGSSVDDNIVVVGSEEVDNVEQVEESTSLGDDRNPLLQKLNLNCRIM